MDLEHPVATQMLLEELQLPVGEWYSMSHNLLERVVG
jgi:hypothetical protein